MKDSTEHTIIFDTIPIAGNENNENMVVPSLGKPFTALILNTIHESLAQFIGLKPSDNYTPLDTRYEITFFVQ